MFGKNRKPTSDPAAKAAGKKAPISAHRGFPAVVALWFAALLGLGSLVLPVALLEKLATATGLSAVVSAAAPPLGATARLLIAAGSGIFGAIAGLVIARKVAAAQREDASGAEISRVQRAPSQLHKGHKRPISAREELGSEYLDEPIDAIDGQTGAYTGRRRSLAVTDDSGPSEYLEMAPLPGGDAAIDSMAAPAKPDSRDAVLDLDALDLDALDLVEEHLDAGVDFADNFGPRPLHDDEPSAPAAAVEEFGMEDAGDPLSFGGNDAGQDLPAGLGAPASDPVLTPREELAAMTNRLTSPRMDASIGPAADAPAGRTYAETPLASASSGDLAAQPLSDLGMVELFERFALALQNKKQDDADAHADADAGEQLAGPEIMPTVSAPSQLSSGALYNPLGDTIADPQEIEAPVFRRSNPVAAEPSENFVTEPQEPQEVQSLPPFAVAAMGAMPSSLQPLGYDDDLDDDDDDAYGVDELGLSLNVPSNRFAKPESEGASDRFSSLLSMKSQQGSGQQFVRVDAELASPRAVDPVVVFPGQESHASYHEIATAENEPVAAPPPMPRAFDAPEGMEPAARSTSSGETEKALREALEKLQRMSGTA